MSVSLPSLSPLGCIGLPLFLLCAFGFVGSQGLLLAFLKEKDIYFQNVRVSAYVKMISIWLRKLYTL